jgi:hypothetical protein
MDSNLTTDEYDWLSKLKGAADAKRDPPLRSSPLQPHRLPIAEHLRSARAVQVRLQVDCALRLVRNASCPRHD